MPHFNPWQAWTEVLAGELSKKGFSVAASELVAPPKPELGDVAVPFFRLAKERGESPAVLAQKAAEAFSDSDGTLIQTLNAAGPYLNVFFSSNLLLEAVKGILQEEKQGESWSEALKRTEAGTYGRQTLQANREPVLFEYANPNTHKEIHIGHLRNFVTGVAYHSLWKTAGIPVTAIQFINDQGANVAKALWGFLRMYWSETEPLEQFSKDEQAGWQGVPRRNPQQALQDECLKKYGIAAVPMARELGRIYAEAGTLIEARGDLAKQEISLIQAKLEANDPTWIEFWKGTRQACIEEIHQICEEMGIVFDRAEPYLESSFLEESARIVDRLEANGMAKPSKGALVVDLETEKLGVCLLRKSDGNLLYLSKDLALAEQKKRDYPDTSASFVLTDDRQALHFKQLQAVLQKMGYGRPYLHLGYGLLTLKEGAMSSRKGNIVTYQWLRDELIAQAFTQTKERHQEDPAWSDARLRETAHALAFGGMKFALLKQDPKSVFLFDREQALSFEGMTGPYCQYAFVRLFSILEKAKWEVLVDGQAPDVLEPAERALILALASLPDVILRAAGIHQGEIDLQKTQPALLAQWCFTTAQAVNAFYRDTPVLDAAPALRNRRLALALAAACVLRNGLRTLTIPVPVAM